MRRHFTAVAKRKGKGLKSEDTKSRIGENAMVRQQAVSGTKALQAQLKYIALVSSLCCNCVIVNQAFLTHTAKSTHTPPRSGVQTSSLKS